MNIVRDDIRRESTRILEDWAMMLVEEAGDPSGFDEGQPCHLATIRFEGVISGEFTIVCQDRFAEKLAQNLLGSDGPVDEATRTDALKELINVLTGNLLTVSYGEDLVFSLTEPRVCALGRSIAELPPDRTFYYSADDEPMAFTFRAEG